jgi:hypothetical protein
MPTPPAAVSPGNLYVDLATLTLWLGVDVSEDPAGAVLISDIVSTTAEIVAAIATSEAYTDAGLAGKANTVHTHVSTDITDFNAAVVAVIAATPSAAIPVGLIAMYSGSLADIGIGVYANWALCDGSGGTPDLRDKFVLGAGLVATGATNPAATAATSASGGHTPVIQGTTLTIAQTPAHTHTGPSHTHSFSDAGVTGTASANHAHGGIPLSDVAGDSFGTAVDGGAPNGGTMTTGQSGSAHTHTFSVSGTTGAGGTGATGSAGGGASHTHGANAVPDHSHTVSSANLKNAIPWYAVAFIMKVS